jgi:predicted metal-dependent hydrolase
MSDCDFNDPRIDEGIRLFNEGEYFACHDVLEDFWGELTCPEKPFFQGLIQAAVALFHFSEGNLGGARRMSMSSRVYMSPFTPSLGGIDVAAFLLALDRCFHELCQPHPSYPAHLTLQPSLIPKIHRNWPAE